MFSDGGKWGNLYYYGLRIHIKGKRKTWETRKKQMERPEKSRLHNCGTTTKAVNYKL